MLDFGSNYFYLSDEMQWVLNFEYNLEEMDSNECHSCISKLIYTNYFKFFEIK